MSKRAKMSSSSKISKRNRILAAALGFVATTGACGAFGTFATFENRALFGEETSTAANRQIVPEPKDGKLESPTGFKAFLVGADDYRDATDLAFVKNDVEALAARLVELGFEEKNVTTLKTGGDFGDFPTKDNIEERFAAFVESLRQGDFAIVYLSGHGIQPTDSKEAFFAPIDVKARDPFETAVSIDKMLAALESSDANFRWMIVDACRNDPTNPKEIFAVKSASAKGLVEIDAAPKSTSLLQSCQPGKVSYEGGNGVKNGVFTLSLLEALDKNNPRADVDKDGSLAFSEVFKYVTERTNELALKHHGAPQTPNWSGQITDFAILSDLLRDGLTQARWLEADALYKEARELCKNREYRKAAQKITQAREINAVNEEYKAEEELIAEMLRLQTEAQGATTAQARAEAERKRLEAEHAAELAEAERRAKEAEAGANVDKAILEKARQLREAAISAAKRKDWGTAVAKMEASLALVESKSSRDLLKKYQAERDRSTPTAPGGGRFGGGTSDDGDVAWDSNPKAGTRKSLEVNGVAYNFRYCPAGTFTMGSPTSERGRGDDETQHRVTLDGFWMLETEVTVGMWRSFVKATNYKMGPGYEGKGGYGYNASMGKFEYGYQYTWDNPGFPQTDAHPVTQVDWAGAKAFCDWLSEETGLFIRLPSEAEWEYACRAGSPSAYFFGSDGEVLTKYGNVADASAKRQFSRWPTVSGEDGYVFTSPVKRFKPNEWNLYDMHGNVFEWCLDWYDSKYYEKSNNVQNPINVTEGSDRVLRGCCWSYDARSCRSANRDRDDPTSRDGFCGFRLALVRSSSSR